MPAFETVLPENTESLHPAANQLPMPHAAALVMVLFRIIAASVLLPRRSMPQSQTFRIVLPSIAAFASFSMTTPSSAPGGYPPPAVGGSPCQPPSITFSSTRLFCPSASHTDAPIVFCRSATTTLSDIVSSLERVAMMLVVRQLRTEKSCMSDSRRPEMA